MIDPSEQLQREIGGWELNTAELDAQTIRLGSLLLSGKCVGVFASARDENQAPLLHKRYGNIADDLGMTIANHGFSLLTGGCPGIISRTQEHFLKHRKNKNQLSIGIRIGALGFDEPANSHLDIHITSRTFGARLELMQRFCLAGIFLGGGLGTLLELSFFLQHAQASTPDRQMPVILMPEDFWKNYRALLENMCAFGTINSHVGELQHLYFVKHVKEALAIITPHARLINGDRL